MQRVIPIFICLMLVLSLRFFFFYHNQNQYKDGEYASFTTTLLSDPQVVGSQQRISANLASGERILVIIPLIPEFHYGDTVAISGNITQRLLNNKKTLLSIYFPKIEAVKSDPRLAVLSAVNSFRQKIISMFSKSLPSPYSSFLLGVTFGIKEPIPTEFKDSLRISGVMHVIAASGMNVTIIGGVISSVFALFLKRRLALILSIGAVIFYAMIAGFEPSIVRASIMGILVFSSQILGRQNMARNGLLLAGFLMLFKDPQLLYDIGFQLSFTATLGLLYIKPLFGSAKQNFKGRGILSKAFKSAINSDVTTTISAQLATLPILLANFGSYSLWSIAANGLVLWTIPILMVIGGVSAVLGLVFMPLGSSLLYLSYPFLLYLEKIVNVFGKMGETVFAETLPWTIIIGYYSMLIACILFFMRKKVHKSSTTFNVPKVVLDKK